MINWQEVVNGIQILFSGGWMLFLWILIGLFIGLFFGALPGVSGVVGVAVCYPLTIYMDPVSGIILLSSIYTGGIYGGGLTALALNIPGTGASVATVFDGYPMTIKGQYYKAVGISLASSIIGCFLGYVWLLFLLVPIGRLVLLFGPSEMLMLVIFAFTVIGFVHKDIVSSLIGGSIGLLLGSIGISPVGAMRGTFGVFELIDGISFVAAVVGLFAVSEALFLVEKESIVEKGDISAKGKFDRTQFLSGMALVVKKPIAVIRSLVIGLLVGIVPAAGSTIAAVVSYGQGRAFAKDRESWGKGNPEGVISAEVANNASEAGAMATLLCFGIPGSGSTAILLGAFIMHGLVPGPYMIREHLDFAYAIIASNFLQAVLLFFVAIVVISFIGKLITIPTCYLIPMIISISFVGAYASRHSWVDVLVVAFFGILGYVMRKLDYPVITIVLGLMLSKILEGEVFRTYRSFSGRFEEILTRPIVLIFLVLIILVTVVPRFMQKRQQNV